MAEVSRSTFKTNTNTLYPDNTSGEISPADLRAQMDDIADSASFKGINKTTAPGVTDDSAGTGGNGAFNVGDIWIDETNDIAYISSNDSAGAAVWLEMSNTNTPVITGTPGINEVAIWNSSQDIQSDSNFTYINGLLAINSTVPIYELIENDQIADNQRWWTWSASSAYRVEPMNNAGSSLGNYAAFKRSTTSLDSLDLVSNNVVRASLQLNNLEFTNFDSRIKTTTANQVILGTADEDRLTIASNTPRVTVQGALSDGTLSTILDVGDSNLTTGVARVVVGNARAGEGAARLDLISDDSTYTTYGVRINRTAGINANTSITHRGTGLYTFDSFDLAPIQFQQASVNALVINTDSSVDIAGDLAIQTDTPSLNFDNTTSADVSTISSDNTVFTIAVDENNAVASSAIEMVIDGNTTPSVRVEPAKFTVNVPTSLLSTVNVQIGTSYAVALADAGAVIVMDNAAANTVTFEIESTTAYPDGFYFDVIQEGAGVTSIQTVSNVSFNDIVGNPATPTGSMTAQYGRVRIQKIGTNKWIGSGDLGAVA